MSSRLVYQERAHRYALDGEWVPSVTTIRGVLDKPGLVWAAAREAAAWASTHRDDLDQLGEEGWRKAATSAHREVWNVSRDKGVLLHSLAESLVYGQPLPDEDPEGTPWPDDVYRSAEQLARFMDAWQVNPVAHEAFVYHAEHHWAGRFDLLADLSDGQRWLLDYKTGASGVYPETSLQLAAYAHATHLVRDGEDVPMPTVNKGGAVWVRPDSWQLVPVAIGPAVYEVFRHLQPAQFWLKTQAADCVRAPLPVPAPKVA